MCASRHPGLLNRTYNNSYTVRWSLCGQIETRAGTSVSSTLPKANTTTATPRELSAVKKPLLRKDRKHPLKSRGMRQGRMTAVHTGEGEGGGGCCQGRAIRAGAQDARVADHQSETVRDIECPTSRPGTQLAEPNGSDHP